MQNKEEHTAPKTLKDRLTLSPVEKYLIFGTFPWKMVMHIILLVFSTWQIMILINTISVAHNRNQLRVFKKLFLDEEKKQEFIKTFITPSQLQEHLEGVVEQFRKMNETVFQEVDFTHTSFSIQSYLLDYSHLTNGSYHASYEIKDIHEPLEEPFNFSDPDSVKEYMSTLYRMVFIADDVQTHMTQNYSRSPCVSWNISLEYDFSSLSDVDVKLVAIPDYCSNEGWVSESQEYQNNSPIIHLLVLLSAMSIIGLNMRYFYKLGSIYMSMKMNYQKMQKEKLRRRSERERVEVMKAMTSLEPDSIANKADDDAYLEVMEDARNWDDLPFSLKAKLFNPWYYFSTAGAFVQILSSLMILGDQVRFKHTEYGKGEFELVGLGNFFAWMQLLCYLSYNQNLTLISTILSKSARTVLVFYGVYIPIFLAFGLMGHAFFWKYEKFESTGTSLQKLFALAGGDIVHEVFRDVHDEGTFKQIYLFFFLIMFFTAFQNIFVAVIMDGYEIAKIRKQIDNNNPFPTPESAQKAVRENRIKVNEGDPEKSPANRIISSQSTPYYWSNSLLMSPSPQIEDKSKSPQIEGKPKAKKLDSFHLDSPAESLRDRGGNADLNDQGNQPVPPFRGEGNNPFDLQGLEFEGHGEETKSAAPKLFVDKQQKRTRSIISDFLKKELKPEDEQSDKQSERSSERQSERQPEKPDKSSVVITEDVETEDLPDLSMKHALTGQLKQATDSQKVSFVEPQNSISPRLSPRIKPQSSSKDEAVINNLRAMTQSIMENIKVMKQEAFVFPATSVLEVQEKKYLQRILFSKLNAITSKIDYITKR